MIIKKKWEYEEKVSCMKEIYTRERQADEESTSSISLFISFLSLSLFLSYHPPSLTTLPLSLSSLCLSSPLHFCSFLRSTVLYLFLRDPLFSPFPLFWHSVSGVCCDLGRGHWASFVEVCGKRCITTFGIWGFCKCLGGLQGGGRLRYEEKVMGGWGFGLNTFWGLTYSNTKRIL